MPKSITPEQDAPEEPIKPEPTQMTYKDAVQYIVDFYLLMSRSAIAEILNKEGVRDARGRKWNLHRVEEVAEANAELKPSWTKPISPDVDIFSETEDGEEAVQEEGGKELSPEEIFAAWSAQEKERQR